MTTREQAWVYQQEQPDDILITGKAKREPNIFYRKFVDTRSDFDKKLDAMTEQEKDEMNFRHLKACGIL